MWMEPHQGFWYEGQNPGRCAPPLKGPEVEEAAPLGAPLLLWPPLLVWPPLVLKPPPERPPELLPPPLPERLPPRLPRLWPPLLEPCCCGEKGAEPLAPLEVAPLVLVVSSVSKSRFGHGHHALEEKLAVDLCDEDEVRWQQIAH